MKQQTIKAMLLALTMIGGGNMVFADEVKVSTATEFGTAYTNAIKSDAANETTIVMAAGTYNASETGLRWNQMEIPYKNVTVKAADGADVTLIIKVRSYEADRNGSLTFDGIKLLSTDANGFIDLSSNSADMGDIIFRNCEITATTTNPLNRCLITGGSNTAGSYGTINSIQFDNCTIHDLGTQYNFIWTTKIVKAVSVTNSTLYNYGGESLFNARTADTDLTFSFTFTNNTVYQWADPTNSRRAFAMVGSNYSSSSVFNFKDNIIDGYKGYTENSTVSNDNFVLVQTNNGGTINILNNILLGFKNSEGSNKNNVVWGTGSPAITNTSYWPWDGTLNDTFGFTTVPFADAANGDFSIELSSYPALATASTVKAPLGAPSTWKYTWNSGTAKAGTLILPFETTIPDGITAYTLTYTSGTTVTATPVATTLPANTPVLINAETASTSYIFAATGEIPETAPENLTSGALTGAYTNTSVAQGYVLQNGSDGLGFYPFTSARTIKPYRAYLNVDPATVSSARGLTIVFDDGETTGISDAVRLMDKGQWIKDNAVYNLNGQRVSQPAKGLYIVNGKKVIIK